MKLNKVILISFALLFVLASCSRKKNTFTRRAYHNTTARYNGYFNAREILKADVKKLREEHRDDFSELIPLFIYPDETKSKSMYPNMERVIDKTTNVIDRHSIYIKNEEHVRWIDDSYLLMGKARFYKQEFYIAIEVFEYVAKAYNKKPSGYEALIWLARTHLELNELKKAEAILKKLEEKKGVPKQFSSDFNAVFTDYYIRVNNREEAIKHLEKALETTRKKHNKIRFNYVLAQLWLKQKEFEQASIYFSKVIKLKPEYEMLFNAKISRALAFNTEGEGQSSIKKMLRKMLKDKKNEDYKDQIYYALADIAFKEEKDSLAIEYLAKSAAYSTSNTKQKAITYLRLGQYYYDIPNYLKSFNYYDSCLTVLPKEYKDYEKIEIRTKALKKLASHIVVVQEQDSLQRMATDINFRTKVIDELIAKAEKEEREKELAENNTSVDFMENTTPGGRTNKGEWYFYNQNTLGFGFSDFRKKWGDRKLEDNWRRTNKESLIPDDESLANENDTSKTDTSGTKVNEKTTPEYYLQFLPLTETKMIASHNKIIEALFALGNIYKEDFQDYPHSVKSFERLILDYDTSSYLLPSWFNLYRISLLIKDDEMEKKYKNLVLKNFPESEYAKLILDPTYNQVTRENRRRVDNYYAIVFELFKDKHFDKVILRCERANTIFAENHIQDKFDFLAALSIGHTMPRDTFKVALETFIENHPESKSKPEAVKILKMMKEGVKIDFEVEKEIPYKHTFDTDFIVVIVVPNTDKQLNTYKNKVVDFNRNNFSELTFEPVKSIFLDTKSQIIIIKPIKGYEKVINYYKALILNKTSLQELNAKEYPTFIISNDNFNLFYKDKDIPYYLNFFKKNFDVSLNN
ncbi:MAG: tetratricopeptide repeat protein [Vicingaceae bacterium]|nr:tetratricopeptide repeat protein [Vicingaceae bacterium]